MASHPDWGYYVRRAQKHLKNDHRVSARPMITKAHNSLIDLLAGRRITLASYRRGMRIITSLYNACSGIEDKNAAA